QAAPQPTPLTKEQRDAYIAHALRFPSPEPQFDRAGREIAEADRRRAKEPDRDPHEARRAKEATDRHLAKRDKDQTRQDKGQRRANVDWYIEKLKRDRARERGDGGRER